MTKEIVNLIYFNRWNNFGDELSKYITEQLINRDKYDLVYNKKHKNINYNLVCIGSYIHAAVNNSFIFGSGVRTLDNKENGHKYNNLNVCAIRGQYSRKYLLKKNIKVPEIYGDPALLLSLFYKPKINDNLKDKIGIVPHKTNYDKYINSELVNNTNYHIINPTKDWKEIINDINSCKCILSSSLHGLICSDAYNIPNLWLDEFKLNEGEFKFIDYFSSQSRKYKKITNVNDFKEEYLYTEGNKIDLNLLKSSFPFN